MDSLPVGKTVILIPTFVSIQAELFDQFLELSAWAASNNISILTVFPLFCLLVFVLAVLKISMRANKKEFNQSLENIDSIDILDSSNRR